MRKNGGNGGGEVVVGNRNFKNNGNRQPGISGLDFWEQGFPSFGGQHNDIEEILKFPDDIGDVMARGNFKSDKQRLAAVWLSNYNEFYNLKRQQTTLKNLVKSTLGMQALGKVLQAQAGSFMLLPTVLRDILGMKHRKDGDQVARGSDFRDPQPPQQNNNGNGMH